MRDDTAFPIKSINITQACLNIYWCGYKSYHKYCHLGENPVYFKLIAKIVTGYNDTEFVHQCRQVRWLTGAVDDNRSSKSISCIIIMVFAFRVSGFKWVRSAWARQIYVTSVEEGGGGGVSVVIKHCRLWGLVGSSKN